MAYTDIDDPTAYFQTTLYTGNGSTTHAITNGGNSDLQPDMVWIKDRGAANWHSITDVARGHSKAIFPNDAAAEDTSNAYVKAFNSDGFTLGSAGSDVNANSNTYVSWQWKAGTSFTNDASGTGIGSIDSAGSFNNDAGLSIVTYTGTGASATLKHGLSTAPKIILIKNRSRSSIEWRSYFSVVGNTKYMVLNETYAVSDADSNFMDDTSPTSSVFSLGSSATPNYDGDNYVAYCFAEKKGYSKFGSYLGNGSNDGTFIYLGFKPAFFMLKGVFGEPWLMYDNKRLGYNVRNDQLIANTAGAEDGSTASWYIDILSNGVKLRGNDTAINGTNSAGYIYMAFAENPFVTSTGVPTTAR